MAHLGVIAGVGNQGLADLRQGGLVPSVDPALNVLLDAFGTPQTRAADKADLERQEAEAEALAGITAGTEEEQERALVRLSALNPQAGNAVRQALERGDAAELLAVKEQAEDGGRRALVLQKQPDLASKKRFLRSEATAAASRGEDPTRLLELSNMSEDRLRVETQKMLVAASDIGAVTTKALEEQQAAKQGFTLGEGQLRFDAQGRPFAAGPPKKATKTSLIKNLEAIGIDPNSPEGRDIVVKSLTKPNIKIDLGEGLDFKVPPGFMLLDKNDPTKGVTPIPGGPKDSLTSENAAKAVMLQTAQKGAIGIRKLVFNADGTLDRTNLFNAAFNTPGTEGRKIRNRMEFGIQAITRLETGAAMPKEEVENTRTRFMPTLLDSVEIATLKLQLFDEFLAGTLKLIDPSGRFDAERFDTELQSRLNAPPPGEESAISTDQTTPEGFQIFQRPDGSTFAVSP